jgi:LPXTG-motif cell wall-anchored protein
MHVTVPQRARRRSLTATALLATVIAVSGAASAPALASGEPTPETIHGIVRVTPKKVRPGEAVDLRVDFCQHSGQVSSDVFTHDVDLQPAADGGLYAEAEIRRDAHPGTYRIDVTCDPHAPDGRGTVTVVDGHGGRDHGRDHGHDGHPYPPPSPIAPVHAGGGGTAGGGHAALGASGTTGLALAGGAVLLGAAVTVTRRRRAHGHTGR